MLARQPEARDPLTRQQQLQQRGDDGDARVEHQPEVAAADDGAGQHFGQGHIAEQAMARKARICRVGATGTALWPRRINHRMAASATAVSATVDSR
ncbi:hypothetical protein G6F60_014564 [Rhizopus arrhizus]|nr:hypothetical protein G6F60_014564 [Rhizopus arrhizus]